MKSKLSIIALVLFAIISTSCAQSGDETNITVKQLKQEMKTDSSVVILDVRTPPELSGPLGKIDGVINIPLQELEQRVDELKPYKGKTINVICRTGHRSRIAADYLLKQGYKIKNVLGGMTQYRAEQ